ncbi:MAG TPA: MFS transporter [Kiritimatiellia bacterium]|nr:MFS transporter [Kiritimatiellia bacterium]HPS06787.1 MFS transporter [Kiritimatiellia bacterium]
MLRIHKVPYKWELVILLWLALFFNQADRQVFNVVLSSIRDDLGLKDADMGLVATVLLMVCGILVPVAGIVGDLFNKKKIIISSLLVWSSATLVTGFSCSIWHLILLRSVATGGGEAFYFPSASSLLGEYHDKTRATALSIHQTAVYVGIISSGYLAGHIADLYGWRMAFYVFGGFGIMLAFILYYRLINPAVRKADLSSPVPHTGVKDALIAVFRKPSFILLALAFSGMNFVGVGFLVWMPTFLHEKYGFSLSRAGFDATFYHHVAAFVGVLVAARITDKLAERIKGIRAIVPMLGLLAGAPFIYFMGQSSSLSTLYVTLVLFGLFRGVYEANLWASVYDMVDVRYRSAATGFMLSFGLVIGALSPYILGILKPAFGLANGFACLSAVYVFSALCILIAVLFFYKKDLCER